MFKKQSLCKLQFLVRANTIKTLTGEKQTIMLIQYIQTMKRLKAACL